MTERRANEPFETRFAGRVRAYTDPATERRVDALAISRAAMSSGRTTGWPRRRLGVGALGRPIAGARWTVAFVAVVLVGVVGLAVLGRSSDFGIGPHGTPAISSTPSPAASAGGPIPDVLRHSWQRPMTVAPGRDLWGSGFLSLASGQLEFGPEPGSGASRAEISAAGPDTLVVKATVETIGCAIGDVGAFRWSLEGKGTVMTLTAIGTDACAAWEKSVAGPWVRSDFPPPADPEATLPPGRHQTSSFDPFGDRAAPIRLSYTVPAGWKVKEDAATTFVLHHLPDAPQGQPSADTFLVLFTQPRMAADFTPGVPCGPVGAAPGVGGGLTDLVTAILARPGVVSTPPAAVTIGGHEGRELDLKLAPSWTGGCVAPEGPFVGVPVLIEGGSTTGPVVGVGPDQPVRLILLDLTDGRTMAVVIFDIGATQPSVFQAHAAEAMPIIESFEFHPPAP